MNTSRRSLLAGAVTMTGAGVAVSSPAAGAPVTATPEVPLSAFAGTTDDDKLADFMAWAAAQTMRGITVVLDEARTYTFLRQQTLYSGFSIKGSGRPQDQARSSMPIGQQVEVRTVGGWFTLAQSQTFGVSIQGLSIDGSSGSRLVEGHPSHVLWTSVFRDISVQNAAGVLGSSQQSSATRPVASMAGGTSTTCASERSTWAAPTRTSSRPRCCSIHLRP